MSALSTIIIWCDATFETKESYRSMKVECEETTNGIPKNPPDSIDIAIFNAVKEQLRSNNVPLITVRTADDALREIKENKDKKTFVICSGTVGRFLVPEIVLQYPLVHDIYIYTSAIALHVDWADGYKQVVKMFDFPTTLFVRLTREIAGHLIRQGRSYLAENAPLDALLYFKHAKRLEIAANEQDKVRGNSITREPNCTLPDFREHLNLLEGNGGLIEQASAAIRTQGYPLEIS